MKNFSVIAAIVTVLLGLTACGGGDGGAGGNESTRPLTISTAGSSSLISGIELVVILPPGVTVKSAANGSVQSDALLASGRAQNNAIIIGNYSPASASMRARVTLAAISVTGFDVGEFATLQCNFAPDATYKDSDFILSVTSAVDRQYTPLVGLNLSAKLGS